MPIFLRRSRTTATVGLALMALGLTGLLVAAWAEYVRTPSISFVDAYWVAREPWTSLGTWTVLAGSVIAVLVGAFVTFIDGSWIRRLLAIASLPLPTYWWMTALGLLPYPRFQGPDPLTFAYSLPETAAIAVLLPALVAAATALLPPRALAVSHMAPVHEEEAPR
jgi:hypothetical protein